MSPVLDKKLDKKLDKIIINKSNETEFNDDTEGDDFLFLDELNGFPLSFPNESNLDSEDTKKAVKQSVLDDLDNEDIKKAVKQRNKNSDVIVISDQKNTPCPTIDDDDEPLPDPDEDDDLCDGDDDELPDFEDDYGW